RPAGMAGLTVCRLKSRKVMLAHQGFRSPLHRLDVQRLKDFPMAAPTGWRTDPPIADSVAIPLSLRIAAWIEVLGDFRGLDDGDVSRKQVAQPHPVGLHGQLARRRKAGHLPQRVDARVGSSRRLELHLLPQQFVERCLNAGFDGLAVRLRLPAYVVRSV